MYLCKKKEVPMALRQGLNGLNKVLFINCTMFSAKNSCHHKPWFRRKHPVVLPHKLVQHKCFPRTSCDDVNRYWSHLQSRGAALGNISPNRNHIPMWIWGDERVLHADMFWGDYRPKTILCWKLFSSRVASHRTKVVIKYVFDFNFNVLGEMTPKKETFSLS